MVADLGRCRKRRRLKTERVITREGAEGGLTPGDSCGEEGWGRELGTWWQSRISMLGTGGKQERGAVRTYPGMSLFMSFK